MTKLRYLLLTAALAAAGCAIHAPAPTPAPAAPGTAPPPAAPAPGTIGPVPAPPAGAGPTPLPGTTPTAPPAGTSVPSTIQVPDGHSVVMQLLAHGAQVFRCESRDGVFSWAFRQPDAELVDAKGKPAGRHGPNFSFENTDGSRLLGHVVGHDAAPQDTSLPWLLIQTDSFGDGQFKGIDFVQRINTSGGMPPPKCLPSQDQQVLRVDFSADFVFYKPR